MRYQIDTAAPLVDLWPSQQTAISKGLLNGTSSIVLRMPTSAGKTRMTELAFINDLFTDPSRRCLYLAPFRALVTEVESHIGGTLTSLGLPVASLYGGSEANELEVELSTIARVLIATPEKMAAVLKLSGGSLSDFGTIVLDEGHLLDSWSRGTSYELQLSLLRPQLTQQSRTIFLSAVLPNADQIAKWLGGSTDSLAMNTWQPTSMRVGVVTWPTNSTGKLSYIAQTGQPLTEQFFVPRLLEEEQWRELNPQTGRLNTHKFPARDNQASIAAALAFQAVKSGPVLIYTMRPDWAESVATRILNRLSLAKPITTNLINSSNEGALIELSEYLKSILGEEAILAKSVAKGFAFHHGQLPQSVRLVIEDEFRRQTIPLLIATNTLAQGVNLPTKTVIVHSLPDSDSPVRDFWNLAGRAGRANRETEGEVIFLMTGSITQRTIRRFLAKDNIESTESRILVFVQELLKRYPMVSPQAIDSLLEDAVNGEKWNHCIRAIDIRLLELIVEDLAEDEVNGILQGLTGGLFATHQLEAREADEREKLKLGIDQLFRLRHERLITRVPQGPRRKRFARAGLSIESCLSIEGAVEEISVSLTEAEDLTRDVFRKIMEIACRTIELANVNTEILTSLGYEWVNLATYEDVFRRGESRFQSLNEAVRFVEDVFCYRVPWVLNGIIRILENSHPWINEEGQVSQQLPPWFKLLPHMMRYGVPTRELVWIMSLGVHDRRLAQWLLDHFSAGRFFPLRSLRQFVEWAIESRAFIIERMSREWPKYFVRQYSGILDRYERINTLLGG
jgi:helicase